MKLLGWATLALLFAPPAHAQLSANIVVAGQSVTTPFGVAIRTTAHRSGVPIEIAVFLNRVRAQCGAVRITSTFRRGARIGRSGRRSCHAIGQAVDYQVQRPACALRLAAGLRLGHSIDYGRVNHFHVSTCAQERGVRFAHYGGRRAKVRYAQYRRR